MEFHVSFYLHSISLVGALSCVFIMGVGACSDDGSNSQDDVLAPDAAGSFDVAVADAEVSSANDAGPDTTGEDLPGDAAGGAGDLLTYCGWYKTCGGTYYDTAEDCAEASIDYWGECRRPMLDAFGACMLAVSCTDWGDPDAFDPTDTPCADEYRAIEEAPCR
jgi:hypothetical protein